MTMPDTERIESTPELENTAACPCGSGKSYEECCAPYHEEKCWPQDTLTMLRTRYCAYAVGAWDYLEKTAWQSEDEEPVTAEMLKERSEGIDWLGLSILQSGRDEEERGHQDDGRQRPQAIASRDLPSHQRLISSVHSSIILSLSPRAMPDDW